MTVGIIFTLFATFQPKYFVTVASLSVLICAYQILIIPLPTNQTITFFTPVLVSIRMNQFSFCRSVWTVAFG
jgi:hypothetical protein